MIDNFSYMYVVLYKILFIFNHWGDCFTEVLDGLDSAKDSLTQATSAIPQDTLNNLIDTLNDVKAKVIEYLGPDSKYIGPYDLYRYIIFMHHFHVICDMTSNNRLVSII